jgi:hypothetical protein
MGPGGSVFKREQPAFRPAPVVPPAMKGSVHLTLFQPERQ